MITLQGQSLSQTLRKLAETVGLSDIYAKTFGGYFQNIKDSPQRRKISPQFYIFNQHY